MIDVSWSARKQEKNKLKIIFSPLKKTRTVCFSDLLAPKDELGNYIPCISHWTSPRLLSNSVN